MKISILIPVYNFDVGNLVRELESQCKKAIGLDDFEILLFDDASPEKYQNANLASDKISFKNLLENAGRSKIRNLLANAAQFDALLYLDCDSAIEKPDFINSYVQHYQDDSVVYGGRTYSNQSPKDTTFFRWKYGVEREIISANTRIQNPYHSFMTNNFLISKKVYLDIQLDEELKGYGHEDTLFGIELKKKKIPIIHIENPAVHIGLETKEVFFEKTKEGIQNLIHLYENKKIKPENTKLLSYYVKMNMFPLKNLFKIYYNSKSVKIEENLKSDNPNMRNFDLWKLNYMLNLNS